MERSPEKREGHVTASVLLGGCLLECFIAADALACPPREIQGFTEEHYHASYELLLCQGGAGFQFANGTAYGYQADTVFLFPPHVRHASLLNRGQRERRTSIRFLVHPWDRARNGGVGDLERALASLREAGCAHFPMDGRMTRLLDMLREDTPGRGELETGGLLAALFGRVLQVLCRSFGQGGTGAGQVLDDTGRRKFLVDHYFDRVADSGEEQGRLKEPQPAQPLPEGDLRRHLQAADGGRAPGQDQVLPPVHGPDLGGDRPADELPQRQQLLPVFQAARGGDPHRVPPAEPAGGGGEGVTS